MPKFRRWPKMAKSDRNLSGQNGSNLKKVQNGQNWSKCKSGQKWLKSGKWPKMAQI